MRSKREAPPVRTKALAYLSRREHTRMELERKLLSKDYSQSEVRETLDALAAESLLSHERFISDYIRSAERRGYGSSRVRWDLKHRKGLGEDEIEKGMAATEVDWVACARRCCKKKFGDASPGSDGEYLKWRSYLFRRGFTGEAVRAALSAEDDGAAGP